MESRLQPGEIPAPVLPEPDDDLFVIHYSQERAEDCTTATPTVSAVIAQHFLTGQQRTFSALFHAERDGIPAADLPAHLASLERRLLEEFLGFAAERPAATWLHWGMRGACFGFEVITQRAHRHGIEPVAFPSERRFDLANYLKRAYGRDYAPHPRLWHASQVNGATGPGFLTEAQAAAAWAAGHHAVLLRSLSLKVHAIARMYELERSGKLKTYASIALSPEAIGPTIASSYPSFQGHNRSQAIRSSTVGPKPPEPDPSEVSPSNEGATSGIAEPGEDELADQLAAAGHHTKSALVRYMKGREWATLDEIKDRVQGDKTNRDGSVKGLASKLTLQLKLMGSTLEYRVRGHRLRKFRSGE